MYSTGDNPQSWWYTSLNGVVDQRVISFSELIYLNKSTINFMKDKYIEDIQIFGMNMPFISLSEAKNAYFMSGEATNEIYTFSLHDMK